MKNIKAVIFFTILFVIVFSIKSFSQTRKELEERKSKTEEEITLTNKLLEETEKSKSAGLSKLLIIKKRIELREQLINDISKEIDILDKNINERNAKIIRLENELKQLKEEYAKMIYFAYKNRSSYDRLMFILSAEDFNQAYRRMKYFQQYTKYRKQQAEQIIVTQKNLEYEIEQIKEQKNEKLVLLSNKERERQNLSLENQRESTELVRLQKREKELRKKIKDNEKVMKQLEKAITDLIEKEAREAKANKTTNKLSANDEQISLGFKSSMGKLSWPVDNGIIINEFGEHPHPVIKGVVVKNDGIDIGTTRDTKVKAIYEGEVKKVFAVPGANMAVIIRHGHYLSLYSNIVNVRVKTGDKIEQGHYLGDLYYSSNSSEASVLHLRIYEETQVLNPKNWLTKH